MAQDREIVEAQYRGTANLQARIALHERFSTNRIGQPRWLFAQMTLPERVRVLEVGCGTGSLWSTNRERIPTGWEITLSDRSPAMVEETARGLYGQPQFRFAMADVAYLPFPDASFDAAIAHFMLYHVPDLPDALTEICRVLRSGGAFFAATNGTRHMIEVREFAAQAGLMASETVAVGDAAGFNLENGEALLASRFAEVKMRRYDDALLITESEPVIAYIQSTWQVQAEVAGLRMDEAARRNTALRALLDERLAADGVIRVTKDSGLFIATRQ